MKAKLVLGLLLTLAGTLITFKGMTSGNGRIINAGIGGVFLGVVLLSFSTVQSVKVDAFSSLLESYSRFMRGLVESLELSGNPVVIPPYENLREGGVFIPLHEDFELDLARFDEGTILMTDVGREREMGILLPGFGSELLRVYEGYLESDVEGMGVGVLEVVSSALKSMGVCQSVSYEEDGRIVRVRVEGLKVSACSNSCSKAPCPLCCSIALAISKALREVTVIRDLKAEGGSVELKVERLGGVENWM